MPNAIKYNTSAESLALKKGNFWIGTGDLGKGTTESTGFYNGITPPTGGYTIYLNKASGGPQIQTAANDTQLITLTNIIAAASYTTANECFNYFAGQSDKMVVNIDYPAIVTDGLICNFDAGFIPSYPKNGTTWYDVSSNTSSLTGYSENPVFTTQSGVECFDFVFGGVSRGFNGSLNGTMPSTSSTVDSWIYANSTNLTGADRGCIVLLNGVSGMYQSFNLGNDNLSNYWYSHPPDGYHEAGIAISRTSWVNVTSVWNYSESNLKQYINGSLIGTFTTSGNSSSGNNLLVGLELCCGTRTFSGKIACVKIYNMQLNATQVLQNYNSMKGRFGL